MQRTIIINPRLNIDIFSGNIHAEIINPFNNATYLAYHVLGKLWMGLKNRTELRDITQ